jgi:hypothetical protein
MIKLVRHSALLEDGEFPAAPVHDPWGNRYLGRRRYFTMDLTVRIPDSEEGRAALARLLSLCEDAPPQSGGGSDDVG